MLQRKSGPTETCLKKKKVEQNINNKNANKPKFMKKQSNCYHWTILKPSQLRIGKEYWTQVNVKKNF